VDDVTVPFLLSSLYSIPSTSYFIISHCTDWYTDTKQKPCSSMLIKAPWWLEGSDITCLEQHVTGVSNYDDANMLVEARNPRLVQRLHRDFVASCNENLVFRVIYVFIVPCNQIKKKSLCRVRNVDPVSLWRAISFLFFTSALHEKKMVHLLLRTFSPRDISLSRPRSTIRFNIINSTFCSQRVSRIFYVLEQRVIISLYTLRP
jgi:hypothetical protein